MTGITFYHHPVLLESKCIWKIGSGCDNTYSFHLACIPLTESSARSSTSSLAQSLSPPACNSPYSVLLSFFRSTCRIHVQHIPNILFSPSFFVSISLFLSPGSSTLSPCVYIFVMYICKPLCNGHICTVHVVR